MKEYSRRERIASALLALLVFAPLGAVLTYLIITDASFRENGAWWGAAGGWGGAIILAKIAFTGRSTRFLEQPAAKALGVEEESND